MTMVVVKAKTMRLKMRDRDEVERLVVLWAWEYGDDDDYYYDDNNDGNEVKKTNVT